MNNTRILQVAALIIIGAIVLFVIPWKNKPQPINVMDFGSCQEAGGMITDGEPVICDYNGKTFPEQTAQPDVIVDLPQYGDLVTSPMTVKGRARGNWYFEANLPVVLKDTNGNILAQKGLHSIGDWMTTNYVDFNDTLTFAIPATQYGVLIISKDNPSGDPNNDASFAVPVRFW